MPKQRRPISSKTDAEQIDAVSQINPQRLEAPIEQIGNRLGPAVSPTGELAEDLAHATPLPVGASTEKPGGCSKAKRHVGVGDDQMARTRKNENGKRLTRNQMAQEPALLVRLERELSRREIVEVPPSWRSVTDPSSRYEGECFYRAFKFISALCRTGAYDDRSLVVYLVHGEYMLQQDHGWVELDEDIVFDGVRQRFYEKAAYYEILGVKPWYKYIPGAAFIILANMPELPGGQVEYCWHCALKLPWSDPNKPIVIDVPDAQKYLVSSGLRPDRADQSHAGGKPAHPHHSAGRKRRADHAQETLIGRRAVHF